MRYFPRSVCVLASSFIALMFIALMAAAPFTHSQDKTATATASVKPPSSVVPAGRTDAGSIARETELIARATDSAPTSILFIGDSITQGWEGGGKTAWDAYLAPLGSLNLGNSGDRTENVLFRLTQAPLTRLKPKHIVLLIGTNNLGHGTSTAEETLLGVTAVAQLLGSQCPTATIHILEIFPRGESINAMRGDICQINQALRTFAQRSGPRYAIHPIGDEFVAPNGTISRDLMPDSLHLTPKAYEIWAKALVPIVK